MVVSALISVNNFIFEMQPIALGVVGVVFAFTVLYMISDYFADWYQSKTVYKDEDDKSIPTIDYVEHRMRRADYHD